MEFISKNNAIEIFSLFLSKLTKIESLFLIGLYYSNCYDFTEEEIYKKIIIAQQLLTYLKRNSFPLLEDRDTIEKLFFDQEDEIDSNCHPDFIIGDEEEVDIGKIENIISDFNKNLVQPISFNFITSQIESTVEENSENPVLTEAKNAIETIERFLKYYPLPTSKKHKKPIYSVLMLGISSGRFIIRFLNKRFSVCFIEDDESKIIKIKNHPYLYRFENNYFENPKECSFSAIWSYTTIARMKKDEIIQTIKKIETALINDDYAFISFMYGNGHKTINNHYYTLMNEETIGTIIAKTPNLKITEMWTSEYIRNDGAASKRLNIILHKKANINELIMNEDNKCTIIEPPKSVDIQKLQLSSRISTMVQPAPGTEIEQKITISRDGRIWITRNKSVNTADGLSLEPFEKKIISIERNIVEKIFFMVYRSVFLNQHEKICDAGEWKLNITTTSGKVYFTTGSFGVPVLYNDEDLCKIIRKSIPFDGLWIFDDLDD